LTDDVAPSLSADVNQLRPQKAKLCLPAQNSLPRTFTKFDGKDRSPGQNKKAGPVLAARENLPDPAKSNFSPPTLNGSSVRHLRRRATNATEPQLLKDSPYPATQ
jgi:hypothetical protein